MTMMSYSDLTRFIYCLVHDHVTPKEMEEAWIKAGEMKVFDKHLIEYAMAMADRVEGNQ